MALQITCAPDLPAVFLAGQGYRILQTAKNLATGDYPPWRIQSNCRLQVLARLRRPTYCWAGLIYYVTAELQLYYFH